VGADLEEAHPDLADPWPLLDAIWAAAMAALHKDDLDRVRDQLDPGRLAVIERGLTLPAVELAAAHRQRNAYYDGWRRFTQGYDLLLTPTLPCTAFPVGQDHPSRIAGREVGYLSWTGLTYPFNLTGQPAATVPCGFDESGLPIGLQIVGRWHDDGTVLRAALAFEQAMPWAHNRPPHA
jgi:aspartyl-tRNA(Asn)/glutamyl-tRNA(Gln) amidotransferase subunit A